MLESDSWLKAFAIAGAAFGAHDAQLRSFARPSLSQGLRSNLCIGSWLSHRVGRCACIRKQDPLLVKRWI